MTAARAAEGLIAPWRAWTRRGPLKLLTTEEEVEADRSLGREPIGMRVARWAKQDSAFLAGHRRPGALFPVATTKNHRELGVSWARTGRALSAWYEHSIEHAVFVESRDRAVPNE